MAISSKIRVMISSRCQDPIPFEGGTVPLSQLRHKLKQTLNAEKLLDLPLFEVWINEDAPAAASSSDSWEHCIEQVHVADLVLVLYNGNSGWARDGGELGICHGELEAGLSRAPAKVRLIALPLVPNRSGEEGMRDQRFRDYVDRHNLFRGQLAQTGEDVLSRCREALRDAIPKMVKLGGRECRKGQGSTGDALEWRRMSFSSRRLAIEKVLRSALLARKGSVEYDGQTLVPFHKQLVLVPCHGIPDSLSVAAAREIIGQPFLQDHLLALIARHAGAGPVHLIGCHESITRAQARKILGFPDAMIVETPFGIYVASDLQKIQLVFVRSCSDESATRLGVQRLFEWLEQSEEAPRLKARAVQRERVVRALAEVNQDKVVPLSQHKPLNQIWGKRHNRKLVMS